MIFHKYEVDLLLQSNKVQVMKITVPEDEIFNSLIHFLFLFHIENNLNKSRRVDDQIKDSRNPKLARSTK